MTRIMSPSLMPTTWPLKDSAASRAGARQVARTRQERRIGPTIVAAEEAVTRQGQISGCVEADGDLRNSMPRIGRAVSSRHGPRTEEGTMQ